MAEAKLEVDTQTDTDRKRGQASVIKCNGCLKKFFFDKLFLSLEIPKQLILRNLPNAAHHLYRLPFNIYIGNI